MALVFKIKHGDTLRRWVVSESVNTEMFPVTLDQLHAKVRELFQFPASAALSITYLDKESDWITLANDHDLVDACLVQHLNPLRLEVQVLESSSGAPDPVHQVAADLNIESYLKLLFPNTTAESLQSFLQRYGQSLDPSPSTAFKDFRAHAGRSELPKPFPSDQHAHHHAYKHPFGDARSKSMPDREERASPNDKSGFAAYHLGIQCDGCGATPIQGPRFISKKVSDYDLCSSCYQGKGNKEEYDRVEQPVFPWSFHDRPYQPPFLRKGMKQFMGQQYMGPPMGRQGFFARGPHGWRSESDFGQGFFARGPYGCRPEGDFGQKQHKKLDARFVKDITIFDGTELAPGTKFTKIWCMSNNGSLAWPQNTQLLHIGGDVLCLQEGVNIELPEDGLACGEEVKVSVDLTAPEKAGRYISHWRLTSPTGHKFGQRVWVTIHVVPQGEQSPMLQESLKEAGEPNSMVQESVKERNSTFIPSTANKSTIDVPIVSKTEEEKEHALGMDAKNPCMEEAASGSGMRESDLLVDKKTLEYPSINEELDGFSIVEKPIIDDEEMTDNTESHHLEKDHEELKLRSLEAMGFMDRELNVALLGKNNGNVQVTVDDLLVAAGWDEAAQDLQEMGFTDRLTNVSLLMRYKGNLKAVVRDLVQMGKQRN